MADCYYDQATENIEARSKTMKMNCQQTQLYGAENSVPEGRTIDPANLQAYVVSLTESKYWEINFPMVDGIEARSLKSGSMSVGTFRSDTPGVGIIEMLPEHHTQLVILHEVAHVVSEARYGSTSHDPWFARTYLELVSVEMGPETYLALQKAFDGANVDHNTDSSAIAGIAI